MAEQISNEIFRFLAVRPPQLTTKTEAKSSMVSDRREDTAENRGALRSFIHRELTDAAASLEKWEQLDKSDLILLFQLYTDLVSHYRDALAHEAESAKTSPPEAEALMRELGESAVRVLHGADETSLWDALYLAFSTGSDSGQRLAYPLAALRLFHFYTHIGSVARPSPSEALEILGRIVLLPYVYREAFEGADVDTQSSEERSEPGESQPMLSRDDKLTLAQDLVAIGQLLGKFEDVRRPGGQDELQSGESAFARTRTAEGGTVAKASDILRVDLSPDQAKVLEGLGVDGETSTTDLRRRLAGHAQALAQLAEQLRDDPTFVSAYHELAHNADSVKLSSGRLVSKPLDFVVPIIEVDIGAEDMSNMIRPLGIGDLLVVKQTLLAYVAGEVSHIENVLHGEEKTRNHRRLDRTEVTIFEATEENKESERDLQTTDRFELQNEVSKTLESESSFGVGVTVTGKYGPVETTVTGNFATKSSQEESSKNSSKFTKEVVDKSVTKVQEKVRSERTTKTITEVEEINIHSLKGIKRDGQHTVGIYRWVDKKYRAQIFNFGPHLLLEFVIPEPAHYLRTSWTAEKEIVVGVEPPPKLMDYYAADGTTRTPTDVLAPDHISEVNYAKYAAHFGVSDVSPMPSEYSSVSTALATPQPQGMGTSFAIKGDDKFIVPQDYSLIAITYAVSATTAAAPTLYLNILGGLIEVADDGAGSGAGKIGGAGTAKTLGVEPQTNEIRKSGNVWHDDITHIVGPSAIPTGLSGYDIYAASATIVAYCKRTPRAEKLWKQGIYKSIVAAWQAQKTAYDQAVEAARQKQENAQIFQSQGLGQNPAINKKVLENELKKHCITMMTGTDRNTAGAIRTDVTPPKLKPHAALRDGRIAQFFEQAFEWSQMTYLFYPYFWGKKSRWIEYQNLEDPDPLFQSFLTAGAVRVVVPAPLAYFNDVMYLLMNPNKAKSLEDKVWKGGDLPKLNDPMYRSLAAELRQQTDELYGGRPDGPPWEFTLPTTLVWLQQDDSMPIKMDGGEQ